MPDTLLNMKAFLATARSGSFSEAARQLGVATSVITKRVNQLEWALNAKLFERTCGPAIPNRRQRSRAMRSAY